MMKNKHRLFKIKNSSCGNGNSGLGLDLSGDAIQISSSLTGQPSATILVLLNNFQSLKSLKSLASQTSGSSDPVRRLASVALANSINLSDGGNSDWRPDVDVAGHGCASDIEPVFVIRSQFLANIGLDEVNPFRDLHLAGILEMCSKGNSEILLAHVLDTDGWHFLLL